MPYSVEVTVQNDPNRSASFVVKPRIDFIDHAQGMTMLGDVLQRLILERMDPDEVDSLYLAITHHLPEPENGTVGFAQFEGLARATGVVVLQQALERGLNGDNEFISPTSPILD